MELENLVMAITGRPMADRYSRRQFLANSAIAASRVAAYSRRQLFANAAIAASRSKRLGWWSRTAT